MHYTFLLSLNECISSGIWMIGTQSITIKKNTTELILKIYRRLGDRMPYTLKEFKVHCRDIGILQLSEYSMLFMF